MPPSPKEVEAEGLKYVSFFYLIAPADDPGMSLEGIEFTEYPKESALSEEDDRRDPPAEPGRQGDVPHRPRALRHEPARDALSRFARDRRRRATR